MGAGKNSQLVVICFQISIFEPLGTIAARAQYATQGCDLLSN